MNKPEYVMVLNDGETYTSLDGCVIVKVPADYSDDIDLFVAKNHSLDPDNRSEFDRAVVGVFEEVSHGEVRLTTRIG